MALIAYLTHPDCLRHDVGRWHPESPRRVQAIDTALRGAPWFDQLLPLLSPYASSEQLLRAHSADHVERVREAVPEEGVNWLDPDTGLNPYSWNAALPALEAFRPQLIFISAGFDAHRDDPLGGLNLVEDDCAWITRELCALAERHACGRLISVLEGGYDLDALGRCAVAHVGAMR